MLHPRAAAKALALFLHGIATIATGLYEPNASQNTLSTIHVINTRKDAV